MSVFRAILPRVDDRDRGAIAFRPSAAAVADSRESAAPKPGVELRGFAYRAEEVGGRRRHDRGADRTASGLAHCGAGACAIPRAGHRRGVCGREALPFAPWKSNRCRTARSCATSSCWFARCCISAIARRGWRCCARRGPACALADLLRISRGAPLVWDALADEAVLAQLSEDGQVRCRRVRSDAGGRVPCAQRQLARALGGTNLAGSRRRELRCIAAGTGTGRRGVRAPAGTGAARSAGCRGFAAAALQICMPTMAARALWKS